MASKDLAPTIGEITAVLGSGASFQGALLFEGHARLDGRFEGEIRGDGVLIVGEGAYVSADIVVGTLIALGGQIFGTVKARDLVELYASARLHADVATPKLYVERGAQLDGKCDMPEGGVEMLTFDGETVVRGEAAESPRSEPAPRPSRPVSDHAPAGAAFALRSKARNEQ